MEISLPPFIEQELNQFVQSGQYGSPVEVIQHGLQLLRDHKELKAAIHVGLAQAERGEVLDGDKVFAELIQQAEANIASRLNGTE